MQFTHARLLVLPGHQFAQPPRQMQAADLPAADWQDVGLPHIATVNKQADSADTESTLVFWYRLDIAARTPPGEPRYLYIPRWKTNGQIAVYGNGQLLYQSEGSIFHNGYNQPLLVRLNPGDGVQAPSEVLLRIERLQNGGSALSSVWAGSAAALLWRYQARYFLQIQLPFMGGAAFLAVGFFSLAVWASRRRDSLYLLFFATSLVAFVRMLHYHVGGHYLLIADDWFQWITVTSMLWLILLAHRFLEHLHQRTLRWLTPCLLAITLLINGVTLPGVSAYLPSLALVTPLLYLLLLPFALLIFAEALRNALRSRSREVWLMAGWFLLTTVLSVYDAALQNNWVSPEGVYINPYGIIGLFVMFTYIMYKRYVGAMGEVEQVNASLAQRLQIREAELAISYERLRDVEHRETISQERQRLTQDMHDGLGSSLVTALRVVESGRMSDAELGDVLKGCIDDLKLTLDSMESVEADLLLLLATLRFRLGPRLSAAGIILKWEVTDLPKLDWIDQRNALHILRILQEAFANILKHTKATEIRVHTAIAGSAEGMGVVVSIEDNGQGFDVDTALAGSSGRGLHNQRRRAQSINSKASWTSSAAGTRFTLWLPVERSGDPAKNQTLV